MSELLEYKCPGCGGAIRFDSGLQKMKCPYCDTELDVDALREYDEVLQQDGTDNMHWEETPGGGWQEGEAETLRSYVCRSCGGEIIGDATLAATACPYCDNPVVMAEQFAGALRPDYVIPFRLDKQAAKEGYLRHLKGKRLLPKVFKDENHIDEIKGIYVPFWLFDTGVNANIRYRATRIRVWSDANFDYTETQHYAVVRGGEIAFSRVPVDGSTKMPDDLMESIEPYDFSQAVDFQTAYLAGFFADKYDVAAEESIDRANRRIRCSTEEAFGATVYGYATVVPERSDIRLHDSRAKYALYPVWLLNTTWQGKKFIFAMNGQTGKFVGDLPLDKGAYHRWLWGLTAGIAAAAFAFIGLIRLMM